MNKLKFLWNSKKIIFNLKLIQLIIILKFRLVLAFELKYKKN